MIDKNLRIEISQKDGNIIKSNNTGGLKVEVDKERLVVIISGEDIDKSIYIRPSNPIKQNKNFLLAVPFILIYLLILWLVPNVHQTEKFLFSSISIILAGFIYSHFYKNITLMFSTIVLLILIASFICRIIPSETLLKILGNFN